MPLSMLFSIFLTLGFAEQVSEVSPPGIDSKGQAGYIDVTHGKLFFWMIEAQKCSCKSPVVIWLNGGPGGASTAAATFENGPVLMQDDGTFADASSTSWNNFANIVYVDQPVGVGYSTATSNVTDTDTAAIDFVDFLHGFYEQYPHLKENQLHIAGESYAGRYISTYVTKLLETGAPRAIDSIMLGNAEIDYAVERSSYADMYCGLGGIAAVLPNDTCASMQQEKSGCLSSLEQCIAEPSYDFCSDADYNNCYDIESAPTNYYNLGGNPYHLGEKCQMASSGLCYTVTDVVGEYFNRDDVKEAFHVDPALQYQLTSEVVSNDWDYLDAFYDGPKLVAGILDHGINALFYNGDRDGIVPWIGTREWLHNMTWAGQDAFQAALHVPTKYAPSGEAYGEASSAGPLTFLRVYNAGHLAPFELPQVAFAMARDWVYHQQL